MLEKRFQGGEIPTKPKRLEKMQATWNEFQLKMEEKRQEVRLSQETKNADTQEKQFTRWDIFEKPKNRQKKTQVGKDQLPQTHKDSQQKLSQNLTISMGSIDVFWEKSQPTYVPLWPNLYVNGILENEESMDEFEQPNIVNAWFFSNEPLLKKQTDGSYLRQDNLPQQIQIEFQYRRLWWRFNIPLASIEKFEIKEDMHLDGDVSTSTTIFIYLHRPVSVNVEEKEKESKFPCVSFLDLTQMMYNNEKAPPPTAAYQLLNLWNVRQVIKLQGKLDDVSMTEEFFERLLESEQIKSFSWHKIDRENTYYISEIEDKSKSEDAEYKIKKRQKSNLVKTLTKQAEKDYLKKLMQRIRQMGVLMDKIFLPVRFGIFALLGEKKLSILDPQLEQLFEDLIQLQGESPDYFESETQYEKIDDLKHALELLYQSSDISAQKNYTKPLCLVLSEILNPKKFELLKKARIDTKSKNFYHAYRIIQTPTLVRVLKLSLDETNRIVREFIKNRREDFLIRISFCNEKGEKDHFSSQKMHSLLKNQVEARLKLGVYIGNTHFKWLGQSNSQIKQKSFWYIGDCDQDRRELMRQFGEFDDEKVPLKKLARMGQIFSGTKFITELEQDQLEEIQDIMRDEYCFTDGNGNISKDLAYEIYSEYGFSNCSAFQVRIGGLKGVMMVREDIGKESKDQKLIQWRNSQNKFKAQDTKLEVIRCSTYSPGFLNRQVIMLMSCQGVPDEVFMKKLKKALNSMNTSLMLKKLKEMATEISQNSEISDETRSKLIRKMRMFFGPSKLFSNVFKSALLCSVELNIKYPEQPEMQFSLQKEPLFDQIIVNMVLGQMVGLKKKARIKIPNCCVLIGVPDQDGYLNEGEIFVQIRPDSFNTQNHQADQDLKKHFKRQLFGVKPEEKIITGDVLVTKNPCSHPGDVRKLVAVDIKELHHLYNVVVFSTKGSRPDQHKLSMGDLDGDTYMLLWDADIVNGFKENYPASENVKVSRKDHKSDDPTDHIINYLQKDNLGRLCNLHMALCDEIGPEGPKNEEMRKLSSLIQESVDFSKHGKAVDPKDYQEFEKKLNGKYPDYLEKEEDSTRKSELILGKIYREINMEALFMQCLDREFQYSIKFQYNLLPWFKESKQLPKVMRWLDDVYEEIVSPMTLSIKDLMVSFSIINEAELFCSDMEFRVDEKQITDKIIGDGARNSADAQKMCNDRIQEIIKIYRKKMFDLIETIRKQDKCPSDQAKIVIAQTIYLATYFHPENFDCQLLLQAKDNKEAFKGQNILKKFATNVAFTPMKKELDFKQFKRAIKKVDDGKNSHRVQEIMQCKKLFCIPWLLCYQQLFII